MRTYQVTRKFQVTIPKKLAEKAGIRPGDSVVFEEREDAILVKKIRERKEKPEELITIIEDFAADVLKVRARIKEAGEALIEDLSRNIVTK